MQCRIERHLNGVDSHWKRCVKNMRKTEFLSVHKQPMHRSATRMAALKRRRAYWFSLVCNEKFSSHFQQSQIEILNTLFRCRPHDNARSLIHSVDTIQLISFDNSMRSSRSSEFCPIFFRKFWSSPGGAVEHTEVANKLNKDPIHSAGIFKRAFVGIPVQTKGTLKNQLYFRLGQERFSRRAASSSPIE